MRDRRKSRWYITWGIAAGVVVAPVLALMALAVGSSAELAAQWAGIMSVPLAIVGGLVAFAQLRFDRRAAQGSRSGAPTSVGRFGSGDVSWPAVMAPAAPSGLVRRARLQQQLLGVLRRREGIVMLCGAGGFGKTTLASWVCHQPEVREQFPDGVLWVELGQHPSDERTVTSLTGLIKAVSGSPPGTYADVPSTAAAFRSTLADRRVLLVVDDAWSAIDLEPFLDVGKEATVLVTTRRRNLLGGVEIPVDALSNDEAVALLGWGQAEAETLRPLLGRAGHWPLGLVMLSGVLRSLVDRHAMTAAEAVTALVDELDRHSIVALDELSDTDVLRGVSQTLELSLAELATTVGGVECKDRFVSLAAFPPGEVVPFWLLQRLWGLSEVQVRAEGDRFVDRMLATVPHAGGLRLHDLTREALRHLEPVVMATVSARLLDTMRPAAGWHRLPAHERSFTHGLAFHLQQAGRMDELADLLRDMRFLVTRLAETGPPALEADLDLGATTYPDKAHVQELARLIRQEGHLLTGRLTEGDIALTLECRLAGQPALLKRIRHVQQARPTAGLAALHPLPDRDDDALIRSFPAHPDGACKAIDWHPGGDLLATVGYGPQLQVVTADAGQQVLSVEISGAVIDGVRWSPNGALLSIIGDTDRFTPRTPAPSGHGDERRLPTSIYALSIYDPSTGNEIDVTSLRSREYIGDLPDFSWAPDSTCLAVASNGKVSLWRPGSGVDPRPLSGADRDDLGWCLSLHWHPEHGLIAHSDTGALLRWANPHGTEAPEIWRDPALRGGNSRDANKSLAWRPGGRLVALQLRDATLVIDPFARRILWRESDRRNKTIHWSPDGSRLALCQTLCEPEAQLVLWEVPPDQELSRGVPPERAAEIPLGTDHDIYHSHAWRPNGSAVATSDRQVIKLWQPNIADDNRGVRWDVSLRSVTWSPNGRTVAVSANERDWFTLDPRNPSAGRRKQATNPYQQRRPTIEWLTEEGAIFDWETQVGIRAEFAPGGHTYALGRWFQPLRVIDPNSTHQTRLHSTQGQQRWYCICFTPSGDRVVAAAADDPWQKMILSTWDLTGSAEERPTAQWITDRKSGPGPTVGHVYRIAASETHAAVVARPGLVGLFRLDGMQCICWVKTNGIVQDAAFDSAGQRLAVVGAKGLYLFAVYDTPDLSATH